MRIRWLHVLVIALIAGSCARTTRSPDETGSTSGVASPTTGPPREEEAGASASLVVDPPDPTAADLAPPSSNIVSAPAVPPPPVCAPTSATLEIDGRPVLVRAPAAQLPGPVVLAIHGFKGTPEGLEYYSQLTDAAATVAATVAYPAGTALDLGYGWNSGAGRLATTGVDDVAVLVDVLDHLLASPCADPTRVYVVGESNGGAMALRAACDPRLHGRIEGVILVNPAIDAGVLATCSRVEPPVALLAVAGRIDTIIPYDGSRDPFIAAESWFAALAPSTSGCAPGTPERSDLSDHVETLTAPDCAACAVLYAVDDGPHTWPGSFEGVNGAIPGTFALTTLVGEVLRQERTSCGVATP